MTSRSLSFKLVLNEVSRNLWALALSVLGFLFAAPVPVLVFLQRECGGMERFGLTREEIRSTVENNLMSVMTSPLPRLGLMIMAVICGVALFRFLHDRRQVDFYHALPVRRERLYAVKFMAGLLLVLPAYFLMQLLMVAVVAGMGFGDLIEWGLLAQWVGVDLISFFIILGLSILSTVLCGNTICAVVLDGWLLFALMSMFQIRETYAYWFYPTHSSYSSAEPWLYSPVMGLAALDTISEPAEAVPLLMYTVLGAAALVLSYLLFRCRRSERAGKAIAFEPLKLPLKVYICLVAGMGFGCIVTALCGYLDIVWLLVFTVIGTAVCHCVMEMIYDADFRAAFRHLPTLVAVTAAAAALTVGLKADVFGYSTWIPKESSVKWVELYNMYANEGSRGANIGNYYDFARDEKLTDPAVIGAVLRLTELGVENLDLRSSNHMSYADREELSKRWAETRFYDITFTYGLSGGRTERRDYSVPITEESSALVNTVLYSEDYLFWHNRAFRFAEERSKDPEIKPVAELADIWRGQLLYTLRDGAEIDALLEALKADVLDFTPEQAAQEGPALSVTFQDYKGEKSASRGYTAAIYPSYTRTLALLKEYADIVPQKLRADEVASIIVDDDRKRIAEDSKTTFTTTDPAEIAQLLEGLVCDEYIDRYGLRVLSRTSVFLFTTDGRQIRLNFQADKVPEALLTERLGSPLAD